MESVPHRPVAPGDSRPRCACGHDAFDHDHYRRGTECGRCACEAYRSIARGGDRLPDGLRAVLRRFAGR